MISQSEMVEKFLTAAEQLTDEAWKVIITRHLAEPRALEDAEATLGTVIVPYTQALRRKKETPEQKQARRDGILARHDRVNAIAQKVKVKVPKVTTATAQKAVRHALTRASTAIDFYSFLKKTTEGREAVAKVLGVFDGHIALPLK